MSRNFKDIVKDFQHALNISYQNTRNIVKVSERYLAELAEAEQSGGGGVDYSTDEQDTGLKWIDGKKIYQKTLTFKTASDNNITSYTHSIANIDKVIDYSGIIDRGDGNFFSINTARWEGSGVDLIGTIVTTSVVYTYINYATYRNKDIYMTIRYTKSA